jgi:serine/threonine protein kinase
MVWPSAGATQLPDEGTTDRTPLGRVYEAEQNRPRRTVALKVVKPGLATVEMRRRFEHESHVLGRLQHPGIAAIFDAGMYSIANQGSPKGGETIPEVDVEP